MDTTTPVERAERWRSLGRRKFTPTEDAVVIGMAANNYSLQDIADHLDRPVSSVQSACRRLRVSTNGGVGGWYGQKRNGGRRVTPTQTSTED
jgi:hypothetical protein